MPRSSAEILRATRPFAEEDRGRTWRLFVITLVAAAAAVAGTLFAPIWLKPVGSVFIALVSMRLFIFLHDTAHGAIFRKDRVGRAIIGLYGLYGLNALPIWSDGHDNHHATNALPLPVPIVGIRLGDLVNRTVTVQQWGALPERDRRLMRTLRHPAVLFGGFFTVFAIGQCLAPLIRNPKRRGWALLALCTLISIFTAVTLCFGLVNALLVVLLPQILGSALGIYMFYAQHNYPAARLVSDPEEWDLVDAALKSSSFFEMPRWMHWFSANVGYHHVHHVNHRIPFYRLPEAMAAIPELQSPGTTSFRPAEVLACLRCSIWSEAEQRLVSFAEADAMGGSKDGGVPPRWSGSPTPSS